MTEEEIEADRILCEEYKIWKKNSPYLYDLVFSHALEWPSLTVQWLPDVTIDNEREISIHKIILGTHTSSDEPNHLMVGEVSLPLATAVLDARCYDDEKGEIGGFGGTLSKIDIKIRMNHEGEVNKARVMPQNKFLVATKSPTSTVFVFDYSKHTSNPEDNICRPQHRCTGHKSEGYGLSWSTISEGRLISGSDDSYVCLWDLTEAGQEVKALQIKKGHDSVVEDVDWSKHHGHVYASVGDDRQMLIWDARDNTNQPSKKVQNAHHDDVNCVQFNPFNEFFVITGSTDKTVALWDLRNLKQSLHKFIGHSEGIYQLDWAPFNERIFASCSSDRRVNVWDIGRIGIEQSAEDAEDGVPELLFVHGGHTAKVSDFHWNRNSDDKWVAASVAEDNILQIWQISETIYDGSFDEIEYDDADIEDEDLEDEDGVNADDENDAEEDEDGDKDDANVDDDEGDEEDKEEEVPILPPPVPKYESPRKRTRQ